MKNNERIAEAMGWELDDGGDALDRLSGEIPATWVNHERNEYRNDLPDYFTDPALLSEMLDWLAERYGVAIECPTLDGPWTLYLYHDGDLLYEEYAGEGVSLQKSIARCVCWALGHE